MALTLSPLGYGNVRFLVSDESEFISAPAAVSFGGLFYSYDGPANIVAQFAGRDIMAKTFGEPDNTNAVEWWNIAKVFDYKLGDVSGVAKAVRVIGDGSLNGAVAVTDTAIVNSTDLTTQRIDNDIQALDATIVFDTHTTVNGGDDSETKYKFFTKYPTAITRKIAMATASDFATANIITGVSFVNEFTDVPETDEVAIAVLDGDNKILEKWIVSTNPLGVDDFNVSNYIETLNEKSSYILAFDNLSNTSPAVSFEAQTFGKGAIVAPVDADYITALSLYEDIESIDINYFVGNTKIMSDIITLCENRQDCQTCWTSKLVDIVGLSSSTILTNLVEYTTTTFNRDTTFGEYFGNIGLFYDEYAKKTRWIELAGDMIGLRILKNLTGAVWEASAGLTDGKIRNVIKLAFNPTPTQMTTMGKNKINPIISKHGKGIVSWGVQTYTSKKSALADSTVQGLLIFIYRNLKPFAEQQLFKINDDVTRSDVTAKTNQFMGTVEAGRGVTDYLVKCDGTNNTPSLIDQGILLLEIRMIPTRVLREVVILARVASTGVELETL